MFTYTKSWSDVDSSLVKGVFYNAPKRQMLVRLDGNKQYVYWNTDENDAEAIATAGSPGAEYNWFRRNRGKGNGGSPAHGEIVTVDSSAPKYVQPTLTTGTVVNTTFTYGQSTKAFFDVTYEVSGTKYTSTVEATDLVAAAQDVAGMLNTLGLNATLTGVVRKN